MVLANDSVRSAPVLGRSNILSPGCAGLITNLPPAARCCSRGRLHSVSVAAPPRCVLPVSRSRFIDVRRSMFDVRRSMFDVRRSTFDVRRSTFDVRRSTFDVPPFFWPSPCPPSSRLRNDGGSFPRSNRVAAWRGFPPSTLNHKLSTHSPTTIPAGVPSAYGGGRWRPFLRFPARFFFFPGFFRVSFWTKKWPNPFKTGPFCVPETVQKNFKKKLTSPCYFVILIPHTVTTKQNTGNI